MMLRRAISGLNMKQGGVVVVVLAFLVRIKVSVLFGPLSSLLTGISGRYVSRGIKIRHWDVPIRYLVWATWMLHGGQYYRERNKIISQNSKVI